MNSCLFRNSRAESRTCYLLSAGLSSVACNTPFSPRIPPCITPLSTTTAARSQARKSRIPLPPPQQAAPRFVNLPIASYPDPVPSRHSHTHHTILTIITSFPHSSRHSHVGGNLHQSHTHHSIPTPTTPFPRRREPTSFPHPPLHPQNHHVIPIPGTSFPYPARHSHTQHAILTIITSFPRRRESRGMRQTRGGSAPRAPRQ